MALIVETGLGLDADANSYVRLADAQAFIAARGLTTTITEGHLLQAMDQLNPLDYCGVRTSQNNPLPMPRVGIYNDDGYQYRINAIPQEMVQAQIWAAYYIAEGQDMTARSTPAIKREKVDVLEIEYAVEDGYRESVGLLSLPNVRHALRNFVSRSRQIQRA